MYTQFEKKSAITVCILVLRMNSTVCLKDKSVLIMKNTQSKIESRLRGYQKKSTISTACMWMHCIFFCKVFSATDVRCSRTRSGCICLSKIWLFLFCLHDVLWTKEFCSFTCPKDIKSVHEYCLLYFCNITEILVTENFCGSIVTFSHPSFSIVRIFYSSGCTLWYEKLYHRVRRNSSFIITAMLEWLK